MKHIDVLQRICDSMESEWDIDNIYGHWYWKAIKDLAFLMWVDENNYWFKK